MKKVLISLMMVLVAAGIAQARDEYAHDASVLPQAAQSVITKNFKGKVSVVKIDKDFGRISEYEVVLDDGTEITFDASGNWKDIETNVNKSVPSSMIPAGVADYVSRNHKGVRIVGIEKDRRGYEVELANGIDIKFNNEGQFLKYD
ncbi:MAG: PepSY-like domain-containing protein [Odoribacter sp.]|nr:PepSY-like domain-containing protein [Odoribacter sp.]